MGKGKCNGVVNHRVALSAQSGKCRILPNLKEDIAPDYLSHGAAQVSGEADVTALQCRTAAIFMTSIMDRGTPETGTRSIKTKFKYL